MGKEVADSGMMAGKFSRDCGECGKAVYFSSGGSKWHDLEGTHHNEENYQVFHIHINFMCVFCVKRCC